MGFGKGDRLTLADPQPALPYSIVTVTAQVGPRLTSTDVIPFGRVMPRQVVVTLHDRLAIVGSDYAKGPSIVLNDLDAAGALAVCGVVYAP
jgi:hypothetical protein